MSTSKRNRMILLLSVIFGSIALDQFSKFLVVRFLKPVGSVPFISGVVDLTYVENRGAAFGMLKDHRWVFMVVSTVAIAAMCVYLFTNKNQTKYKTLSDISLAMIVGGGVGNMIDRIFLGYVVDFIDVSPLFEFAVFNGADSFVCVGAGLLFLATLLDLLDEVKQNKQKPTVNGKDDSAL